ncbi:MAG: hypothetical protein PSX81_11875 [bacterium]|nr:hypothetical protein [bacterium]
MIAKKDISKDTLIIYKLHKKAISLYRINGDSAIKECKKKIRGFRFINISTNNNSIFASIMFQTGNNINARYRYAILKFDTSLIFRNLYVMREQNFDAYTIYPPFQPNEFANNGQIELIHYQSSDSSLFNYSAFEFIEKRNEFKINHNLTGSFKLLKYSLLEANRRSLLSPIIYPVYNSNAEYFYHYPNPILYNIKNGKIIDPYKQKNNVDSLNKANKNQVVSNLSLNFENDQVNWKNIILTSTKIGQYIYLVVSNRNRLKIDLVRFDLVSSNARILTIDMPLKDHYFIFKESELFVLNIEETKTIEKISLLKLDFD